MPSVDCYINKSLPRCYMAFENSELMGSQAQEATQKLLRLWIGANTLGFAIATPLSFLANISAQYFEALYIAGLIIGAVVGPLQAIVLKQRLPKLKIWQWVLANILGSYLGSWSGLLVLGMIAVNIESFEQLAGLNSSISFIVTIAIYGSTIGVIVGAAQLLSLQNHTQNLRQWWLASFLGRLLGWLMAATLGWIISSITDIFATAFFSTWGILLGAVGGATYGRVTAKALLRLKPRDQMS